MLLLLRPLVTLAWIAGCGARSHLEMDGGVDVRDGRDASLPVVRDGGAEGGSDAGADGGPDSGSDGGSDAGADAGSDCAPGRDADRPDGLVSWYRGEGDGSDSAGGNEGNLEGGVAFTCSRGGLGQAFDFTGGGSDVLIPNTPDLVPAQVTLVAWIRPARSNAYLGLVTTEPTGGTNSNGYGLRQRRDVEGNTFAFNVGEEGDGRAFPRATTSIVPGDWYHVAGTYDGTTARIFVNGELEGSVVNTLTIDTTFPLIIGRLNSGSEPFDGALDEVAVYDRALSGEEIQALYEE